MLVSIFSLMVSVIGVAVSVWIAIRLQRGSSQLAQESNRIFGHIRDLTLSIQTLTKLGRRDETYRALQTVRDPDLLHWYVTEGRELTPEGTERVAMERFYYANPATPLVTEETLATEKLSPTLHRDIVQAAVTSLPHRYGVPQDYWEGDRLRRDLGKLLPLAYRIDEANAGMISSEALPLEATFAFIRALLLEGWQLTLHNIKPLVTPWQPDIAKHFLFIIEDTQIPKAIFVRLLTAISWHIHDELYSMNKNGAGIDSGHHTLLHAYASLLHQDYLQDIGSWPQGEDMTDSVFQCIGSTTYAIGILAQPGPPEASTASHITRNLIVDLTTALQSFENTQVGRFRDGMLQLAFGVRHLVEKHANRTFTDPLVEAANILLAQSHLGPVEP
ncbi:hypothetical protein BAB79_08665 [Mycobacteroides abscessus]|nr:hypothetical protein A3O06_08670 [Mycobacteroides abscessus]ANO23649.1 hypothetical protein BAB79_08665 [Mycobacteroides abscessus]